MIAPISPIHVRTGEIRLWQGCFGRAETGMASHNEEEHMKLLSGLVALGAGLFAASVAMAADPPDLVGTWKATGEGHASIRLGEANDYNAATETPIFGSPENAWTIVIKEQKGRAFHGVAQSPKSGEEAIVGVVSFDGDHLLIAADEAGMFGEVLDANKIEFCFQDHEDHRAGVACVVAAKQ
jgi:hypothetical protein